MNLTPNEFLYHINGYILTNAHIVEDANLVIVMYYDTNNIKRNTLLTNCREHPTNLFTFSFILLVNSSISIFKLLCRMVY